MLFLTAQQHQEVVQRLLELGRKHIDNIPFHSAGAEYTSLMMCFLLHNWSAAESLIRLSRAFGNEWFPVTVGYAIARTMFEADVTAHYISLDPAKRSRQYIDYGRVLNKRKMDACQKHSHSKDPQWREYLNLLWKHSWEAKQQEIIKKCGAVEHQFTRKDKKGKKTISPNWSGKSLYKMAEDVNHVEAYDIFYAELSSFTHVDVHLADRFLQNRSDGPVWSQRANEGDVGNVFRHAANFLTCFMKLFGQQFSVWDDKAVDTCWVFDAKTI